LVRARWVAHRKADETADTADGMVQVFSANDIGASNVVHQSNSASMSLQDVAACLPGAGALSWQLPWDYKNNSKTHGGKAEPFASEPDHLDGLNFQSSSSLTGFVAQPSVSYQTA
jgi:hypothetical protein